VLGQLGEALDLALALEAGGMVGGQGLDQARDPVAAGLKRTQAHTGAVTLIQRFGSAANLNIHLHCLVLDGVYRTTDGVPVFHEVHAPTTGELQGLLSRIIRRLMKFLTRKGYLIEAQGMTTLTDPDPETALGPLQAAACTYRIALGPRAGQKVLSLQTVPTQEAQHAQQRCVNAQGFEGARQGALCRSSAQETRTPVPLYHPPRRGQRAPDTQPCRAGGAHAEDTLSRWHDPHRHVATGVYGATRHAGSPSAVASDPL
jgi:hypothetical protein